ncbi:hypothetical protein AK812_SmicGene17632 [Symbiodinium microadriaticum]|uniref:Uncharacterized protein n=1 Tax=Symbiodinium microadriaticum TaxID=2951 RepID=A0A1Q9DX94_SYMMI|nr:hypothetical protein AK812_SmicGene17632 [Symbiodinium microadriaticum]
MPFTRTAKTFQPSRIPGFLISKAEGEALQAQLERWEAGEELPVACSWSPLEIWWRGPGQQDEEDSEGEVSEDDVKIICASVVLAFEAQEDELYEALKSEANDSLLLTNVGDEDMDWVIDVIDTNETFGKDPFYRAKVTQAQAELPQDVLGESWDHLTLFNGTARLPFDFPHYLEFSDRVFVTSNGLLGFHPFDLLGSAVIGGLALPCPVLPCKAKHYAGVLRWADFVLPVNATISALWQSSFPAGSTPMQLTISYRDLMLKEPRVGPFRFRVALGSDGSIDVLLEDFPTQNISFWSSELQLGMAVSLTPWLLVRGHSRIPPNESRQLNLSFGREEDLHAWFFLYAEQSIGSWHPRRNIRASGFKVLCNASSDISGCLVPGTVASTAARLGSCMDLDPTYGDGYPTKGGKEVPGEEGGNVRSLLPGGITENRYPFFSGTCLAVTCPEHSTGASVPTGCVCDPGYIGEIEDSQHLNIQHKDTRRPSHYNTHHNSIFLRNFQQHDRVFHYDLEQQKHESNKPHQHWERYRHGHFDFHEGVDAQQYQHDRVFHYDLEQQKHESNKPHQHWERYRHGHFDFHEGVDAQQYQHDRVFHYDLEQQKHESNKPHQHWERYRHGHFDFHEGVDAQQYQHDRVFHYDLEQQKHESNKPHQHWERYRHGHFDFHEGVCDPGYIGEIEDSQHLNIQHKDTRRPSHYNTHHNSIFLRNFQQHDRVFHYDLEQQKHESNKPHQHWERYRHGHFDFHEGVDAQQYQHDRVFHYDLEQQKHESNKPHQHWERYRHGHFDFHEGVDAQQYQHDRVFHYDLEQQKHESNKPHQHWERYRHGHFDFHEGVDAQQYQHDRVFHYDLEQQKHESNKPHQHWELYRHGHFDFHEGVDAQQYQHNSVFHYDLEQQKHESNKPHQHWELYRHVFHYDLEQQKHESNKPHQHWELYRHVFHYDLEQQKHESNKPHQHWELYRHVFHYDLEQQKHESNKPHQHWELYRHVFHYDLEQQKHESNKPHQHWELYRHVFHYDLEQQKHESNKPHQHWELYRHVFHYDLEQQKHESNKSHQHWELYRRGHVDFHEGVDDRQYQHNSDFEQQKHESIKPYQQCELYWHGHFDFDRGADAQQYQHGRVFHYDFECELYWHRLFDFHKGVDAQQYQHSRVLHDDFEQHKHESNNPHQHWELYWHEHCDFHEGVDARQYQHNSDFEQQKHESIKPYQQCELYWHGHFDFDRGADAQQYQHGRVFHYDFECELYWHRLFDFHKGVDAQQYQHSRVLHDDFEQHKHESNNPHQHWELYWHEHCDFHEGVDARQYQHNSDFEQQKHESIKPYQQCELYWHGHFDFDRGADAQQYQHGRVFHYDFECELYWHRHFDDHKGVDAQQYQHNSVFHYDLEQQKHESNKPYRHWELYWHGHFDFHRGAATLEEAVLALSETGEAFGSSNDQLLLSILVCRTQEAQRPGVPDGIAGLKERPLKGVEVSQWYAKLFRKTVPFSAAAPLAEILRRPHYVAVGPGRSGDDQVGDTIGGYSDAV